MFDFVTIIYNNNIEKELMKLQAYSFVKVNPNIINSIVVIYNEKDKDKEYLDILYNCYPENMT